MYNQLMTSAELADAYKRGIHGVYSVSVRPRRSGMLSVSLYAVSTLFVALRAFGGRYV
jgi:hypothetical protein